MVGGKDLLAMDMDIKTDPLARAKKKKRKGKEKERLARALDAEISDLAGAEAMMASNGNEVNFDADKLLEGIGASKEDREFIRQMDKNKLEPVDMDAVDMAMGDVQEAAAKRFGDYKKVENKNKKLEEFLDDQKQKLTQAVAELRMKDDAISGLKYENQELSKAMEQEADNATLMREQYEQAEERVQLLQQKNEDTMKEKLAEIGARKQLEKDLDTVAKEMQDLFYENKQFQQNITQMQKDLDKSELLRHKTIKEWREKHEDLQARYEEALEQKAKLQQDSQLLAEEVDTLQNQNGNLEKELAKQEDNINGIFAEYDAHTVELQRLQQQNVRLQRKLEKSDKDHKVTMGRLEKSNDDLRKMAEKVFQLVTQLNVMDSWKKKAQKDLKENHKRIEVLQRRSTQVKRNLSSERERREHIEVEMKKLAATSTKYRKDAVAVNSKFRQQLEITEKLRDLIEAKTRSNRNLLGQRKLLKNNARRQRLEPDIDAAGENKQLKLEQQQRKLNALVHNNEFLEKKINALEEVNMRYVQKIRKSDKQLEELRAQKKVRNVVSKHKPDRSGGAVDTGAIRRALGSSDGSHIAKLAACLQIEDRQLFQWLNSTPILISKLAERFTTVQDHVDSTFFTSPAEDGDDEERVQTLSARNAELAARLQECEEAKSKAIMRMAAVLSSALQNKKGSHDLVLSLQSNGIENKEAFLIADALSSADHIVKVDLDSNAVSNEGLMALTRACIENEQLNHLSLEGNKVTFKGLKELYFFLRDSSSSESPPSFESSMGRHVAIVRCYVNGKDITIDIRGNEFSPERIGDLLNGDTMVEEEEDVGAAKRATGRRLARSYDSWLKTQGLAAATSEPEPAKDSIIAKVRQERSKGSARSGRNQDEVISTAMGQYRRSHEMADRSENSIRRARGRTNKSGRGKMPGLKDRLANSPMNM